MKQFVKKRRCLFHKRYVTKRMAELSNEILHEALSTGKVNLEKRKQLLKYKDYLKNLWQKKSNQYLILFKNI